jgi:cell division protein FtsZ
MPINIRMHPKEVQTLSPKIKVIGVGGAGGNAISNMIAAGLEGVEFLACNTDAQALDRNYCETKLQLGASITNGLGAGAKPEVGREAAEESLDQVLQYLEGVNMVFITAGMGGGTGTGAAPVIAKAAREKGILTVGVVTKPFHFEGSYRMKMAEAGIEEMQDYVDTLIVIPNQNLFRIANEKTTFAEAFRMADSVLQSAVRGVTDLMVRPGDVNLDFADIRSVMLEMGKAMMGTGEATGEDRAERAAEAAINNPLLDDVSMKGARGVIINVTGGHDITLFEVDQACNRIRDEVDPNANIIVGSSFDESMDGVMRVSVVATGIDVMEDKARGNNSNSGKTTSGRSWNASTEAARRLDRAPQAESTVRQPDPMPVQAPVSYVQPAQTFNRPVPTAAAANLASVTAPVARKLDPSDMFEARDYPGQELIGKKPEAASAPLSGALRGSVVNNAFIPPQPVEVDRPRPEINYGPQFGNQSGIAAPARREDMPTVAAQDAAPGFMTRPQSAEAQPSVMKRASSLLDRIAGTLRHHDDAPVEVKTITAQPVASLTAPAATPAPASSGSFHGVRVQARPETQGNLAIDAPSIKAEAQSIDDELDIPAFLRRQAN